MTKKPVAYRVEIPEFITVNPEQAIIDGFTILHKKFGMPAAERMLEAVMDALLAHQED